MRQSADQQPITALRAALSSPWGSLRDEAIHLIRRELRRQGTLTLAAEALGVPRVALSRLKQDFPDVFDLPDPATKQEKSGKARGRKKDRSLS